KRVFGGAFAHAVTRGEPVQSLVRAPRQPGGRAHSVDDGAANADARVATKRHPARDVELPRRVEQPLASEAQELVQRRTSAELAREPSRNAIDERKARLEQRVDLRLGGHVGPSSVRLYSPRPSGGKTRSHTNFSRNSGKTPAERGET